MVRVRKKSFGGIVTIDEPEDAPPVESSSVVDSAIINAHKKQEELHQASNSLFRGVLSLTNSEKMGIEHDLGEVGNLLYAMNAEGLSSDEMKDCLTLHYDFLSQAKENSEENPYPTDV